MVNVQKEIYIDSSFVRKAPVWIWNFLQERAITWKC